MRSGVASYNFVISAKHVARENECMIYLKTVVVVFFFFAAITNFTRNTFLYFLAAYFALSGSSAR